MKKLFAALVLLLGVAFAEVTVGFIYVGPVGDAGWTYAHDLGRLALERDIPGVETIFVESVAEPDVEPFIDQMVADGADIIFATSFGYGDGVLAAAERYPDVIFGHATGIERAPNVFTFIAELYQPYYINGLIAGALTQSNDIGYVAAFPIPEVKRHINAFALGAREVNPDAVVHVVWLNSWFDPAGAKEATEALMSQGIDVFAFTEDTPTVIQTAAARGLPSFSHNAAMLEFSPDTVVSGQIAQWDSIYTRFVQGVIDGTYTAENLEDEDWFFGLAEGGVIAAASEDVVLNELYVDELQTVWVDDITAFDLVHERIEAMTSGTFEPFTGPLYDRQGNLVLAEGQVITVDELLSMQWAMPNVDGPWPNE